MVEINVDDVSSHKIPEQGLISAVIAMAVRDACIKPLKDGKHLRMTWDATTAHDFLWTESLDSFLHWLDIDAGYFRSNLIRTMGDDSEKQIGQFSSNDRRNFRINRKLWEIEHERLGTRLADPGSKNWSAVEGIARKESDEVSRTPVRYSNGIEALVQYHQAHPGE